MFIDIRWMDKTTEQWKVTEDKYNTIDYYIRDGAIDFWSFGKAIIIPLNNVKWIEIEK